MGGGGGGVAVGQNFTSKNFYSIPVSEFD